MKLSIVTDNPKSWFVPFSQQLVAKLSRYGEARFFGSPEQVQEGDIAFYLSCETIVRKSVLALNRNNIVVHASDLPKGKGMSPLTWQVLEGKNVIPVSLFEAVTKVDAGRIYLKDQLILSGGELLPEMQAKLGEKIVAMCEHFVAHYPSILDSASEQSGEETFYRRRTPADSELDPAKSIADQFDLLRVVDNDRYPAFFNLRGRRFRLKIEVSDEG